jgi:PAS domain S-box-containing protein
VSRSVLSAVRFSFLAKVCFFLTLFILVITIAFTVLFVHYQRGMLVQTLVRNGEVLSGIISRNARLAVISESQDLLRDVIDAGFGQDKVIQMMIYNDRGDLLTWRARKNHPTSAGEPRPKILKTVAARMDGAASVYVRDGAEVVEFWSAVAPEGPYQSEESLFLDDDAAAPKASTAAPIAGWIGICVDKSELNREFRALIRRSFLVGLAFWILGSVVVFIAIRRITRPLKQLHAGVEAVESGGQAVRVAEDRRDELGNLARAFNRMAGTIQAKEAALRASEEKYRSIVENATEGIFQTDPDGRIVMANPALADMLGYDSARGMVRERIGILGHVQVDEDQRARFRERIRNGEYGTAFETVCRRNDGGTVPVLVNVHVVRDEEGRVALYEGLVQDVTPWKQAERLKVAKEAAEASAEAKSRFLANMSHEIRTPLGAITGMVAVLNRSPDIAPDWKRRLEKIESEAQTLLGLIEDILDFSRIEAGKLRLEKIPFAWAPVARQLAELFVDKAAEKEIDLVFKLEDDIPAAMIGSPLRLRQVLTNLIGNAVKFTPEGGRVLVTGHAHRRYDNGGLNLVFRVEDTGIGIPPEKQAEIFESFTQSDDSTSRKYGGAGLGLAICKQLVEMMGGRIQVLSMAGGGSHFTFTVPVEETDEIPAEGTGDGGGRPVAPLGGARILVVEDHPINQEVVQNLLEAEGVHVSVAGNGHEALAALADSDCDAVLMDVQMPGMDGLEATRRIRETRPDLAGMPVIAMTAHALPEERDKCLDAGMADVVTKPLDLKKLFDVLARHLSFREDAAPDRTARDPAVSGSGAAGEPPIPGDLPGIDAADARERLLGNRHLLGRLLRQLVDDYRDAADRLRSLLEEGRRSEARMLAHTLKGVAGNCSARPLFRIAADLEGVLHDGEKDPDPADLDRLDEALTAVAAAAQRLEAEIPPAPKPPAAARRVSPDELARRFRTLDDLLRRHKLQAEEVLPGLTAVLPNGRYADLVKKLDRQIWNFQYKEARRTLAEMAGIAGISLTELPAESV